MRKLSLLLAAGAGYVLGTKAGRERYDQIVASVKKFAGSQPVQDGVAKAGDTVKEQAPVVKDKVTDAAHRVADKVTPGSASGGEAMPPASPNRPSSITDDADITGTYSSTPGGAHVEVDEELAWTTSTEDPKPPR